mgnify:CR=1 FL=1
MLPRSSQPELQDLTASVCEYYSGQSIWKSNLPHVQAAKNVKLLY